MASLRPITHLDTHDVANQPPPLEDINLFTTDLALREAVARGDAAGSLGALHAFGRRCGSAEAMGWGVDAERNPPVLETHDRYGQRIDEVHFHPAYHQLMALGLDNGFAAIAWNGTQAGHASHAAMLHLAAQVDPGTTCPMTMTYAAIAALCEESVVAAEWSPRILSGRYDGAARPARDKAGVTIGMAMTEKQGGSDVRANSTQAEPAGEDEWYSLTGHKWFCSAPMSDAFLTLAYARGGLTCFLVPRWLPDDTRNAGFRIVRLKDKMGDRSNASSEIEYHGALAQRIGAEGRGVATIIRMVQHTRLDCVMGSAGHMRSAVVQALWHCAHRTAFQKQLIDQPAMAAVLADLAIESEAATAMGMRIARTFDEGDPLGRLLTPIAKYWVCKRESGVANEAMECLGGAGYIETGPMPRLFRQSPLNAIWEGSGNVIALDLLRAIAREPHGVEALQQFITRHRGCHAAYDAMVERLDVASMTEGQARQLIERLARLTQAATLFEAESPVAEAYCDTRLGGAYAMYGAFEAAIDTRTIITRAMPAM